MAKLKDLEKYLGYEFPSGPHTGEDYKSFEGKYINYLKTILNENGWELIKVNKNHYEFSAFFKHESRYVYMAISDVRYWNNEWHNHILIRTAQNEVDYHGGQNHYCSLQNLIASINNLIGENL